MERNRDEHGDGISFNWCTTGLILATPKDNLALASRCVSLHPTRAVARLTGIMMKQKTTILKMFEFNLLVKFFPFPLTIFIPTKRQMDQECGEEARTKKAASRTPWPPDDERPMADTSTTAADDARAGARVIPKCQSHAFYSIDDLCLRAASFLLTALCTPPSKARATTSFAASRPCCHEPCQWEITCCSLGQQSVASLVVAGEGAASGLGGCLPRLPQSGGCFLK